ncbi:MAG TPA: type II toxin-antitoxin system HipA family toxin [Baekduia sp.]|nr:type II toxin-antitoxin system HipA family toxin [Baekduia sp.]
MAEPQQQLAVWCFERRAGTLTATSTGLRFEYDPAWRAAGLPPLSQSLPLGGDYSDAAAGAFFGGLLPEGAPRERLARRLGVSAGNDFGLLAAVAGDTAGAISVRPPGDVPQPASSAVQWLDDETLATLIDELPSRPLHADPDGEYRLSLAGVQDKLPVVVGQDGRIGLTKGETPSTHILKTPIERFDDTVANEAFCLALAGKLGIDAAKASSRRVLDRQFLLVERYDRERSGGSVRRLHQEDFCQALGIPVHRKYQAEGGPSIADCVALLRASAAVPATAVLKFVDALALSFLVGNHDAHGKNFSLLYLPTSARATLAPSYDIVSTVAYQRSHDLTRKMAMSIGGEYRPEYLRPRHLDRLLDEAGLGAGAARRRLRAIASGASAAARDLRTEFAADGWDAPVLARIVEIVDERAEWLAALTGTGSR